MMAGRVVARYLAAYKDRGPGLVPVKNRDTERTVYVRPETLKEDSSRFQKIPESQLDSDGDAAQPGRPGQPHLPAKPRKPHKPEIPRDPPPAPIHPPVEPKPRKEPKRPKPVAPLKPPKVPKPSPKPKYEKPKRYLHLAAVVVARYLATVRASS